MKNHNLLYTTIFLLFAFILIVMASGYILLQSLPEVTDAKIRTVDILKEHKGVYVGLPIPQKVGDAVVAIEDRRFYQHHGIDSIGLIKTVFLDMQTDYPNGGATITEQLAKNLYIPNDDSAIAKIKISGLALKLEMTYSKQDILDMYLNAIYFGHQEYGIYSASEGYFHKTPYQLDWAQASLLAGLPQAPSYYDPTRNLPAAKARQEMVLNALTRSGELTNGNALSAYNELMF